MIVGFEDTEMAVLQTANLLGVSSGWGRNDTARAIERAMAATMATSPMRRAGILVKDNEEFFRWAHELGFGVCLYDRRRGESPYLRRC